MTLRALLLLPLLSACISEKRQTQSAAHVDLGAAMMGEGNSAGAIATLQQATQEDPRSWDAWNKLGLAYLARGAPEMAEKAFKRSLRLAPKNGEVLNNYGYFLMNQRRFEEAVPFFDKASMDLTYRNPGLALNNLGYALLQLGRNEEAVARLNEAVARAPNLCQPRFTRGVALRAINQPARALDDFEAVIELCGANAAGAWYQAAELLIDLQDRTGACTYLNHVIQAASEGPLGQQARTLSAKECG